MALGGPKDMKEINDWVSQETGGKVQRFLTKSLPRNSGVNTVSAAYFKGMSNFIKSYWLSNISKESL